MRPYRAPRDSAHGIPRTGDEAEWGGNRDGAQGSGGHGHVGFCGPGRADGRRHRPGVGGGAAGAVREAAAGPAGDVRPGRAPGSRELSGGGGPPVLGSRGLDQAGARGPGDDDLRCGGGGASRRDRGGQPWHPREAAPLHRQRAAGGSSALTLLGDGCRHEERSVTTREIRKRLKAGALALRAFYSQPVAWLAVLVTSAVLGYAGGAVMFWFHALYRGEQGPAISPWYHWLLDASLAFFGLMPAIFLILPAALWMLQRRGEGSSLARTGRYAGMVGALFAAGTGPGPLLHDLIAGRGTLLARTAQTLFGTDPSVLHRAEVSH